MWLYHLWLLIQKSLRYAWRRRICRCCPKIIFELFVPIICLLLLCLLRWVHTPLKNGQTPARINIAAATIVPETESIPVLNYTSVYRCPTPNITIQIAAKDLLNRFQRQCSRSRFVSAVPSQHFSNFILNTTTYPHTAIYQCGYGDQDLCRNLNLLNKNEDSLQIQHPSTSLCTFSKNSESNQLVQAYLSLESLLFPPPLPKRQLFVYTWPCSSYASDPLFKLAPQFTLSFMFVFMDGYILFSFFLLLHALLDEKRQGITELLRLLSIRPLLNSLAWLIRVLAVQLISSVFLIIILKISFDGGIYLQYVSLGLIIPAILLWTVQVLSRAVLVAHIFSSTLKAYLWSWFIYLISFWLALSSSVELPMALRLLASAWLPFYSIKRLFILLVRINTDVGRYSSSNTEAILIILSMLMGTLLMWLLAAYLEPIRPGKYGVPRPWSWPLDYCRRRREKQQKRRASVDMQMVDTVVDEKTTVKVNNLTKSYGHRKTDRQVAVDHVSFTLQHSTIHGLIGHNGAGKTSTMEMMCGLLSCDCGTIEIDDKDLFDHIHELRTCIGYCPQQDMLFSHLTVQEQLEFYARVRSQTNQIDQVQIQELLAMLDMNTYSHRLCHTLSGGMQRKLSILCAFVGQANVILLDEPSSSLDPVARRALWSWLRQHKTGRTLLISSHLLDEVEELCDSVIILDAGRVRAQGTVLELKRRFGPPGDRLQLDVLPSYVPQEWIINENDRYVQVPDRRQMIRLLEQLERDNIRYALVNTTLDDIFLKLISSSDSQSQDEIDVKTQIDTLFATRTSTQRTHLWSQQALGVLIKRGQVYMRRARLLPIIILLYLAYALAPLYMPSSPPSASVSSIQRTRFIVSSPSDLIAGLNLSQHKNQLIPYLNSSYQFEKYLLGIQIWQHRRMDEKLVGIRVISPDQLECYIPSPVWPNLISSCLTVFSSFANRTRLPFHVIERETIRSKSPELALFSEDAIYLCLHTLPPALHLAIVLLSVILVVCAAFAIQDHASGLHAYSLVHGLRSPIHWSITFICDLVLCLGWLLILILISRFVHPSNHNGIFFAFTPLFFIVNLPFIYLLAKFFRAPILGATVIVFILNIAHAFNTFKMLMELFRAYRTLSTLVHIARWLLLLVFPNVNVFTLIVAVLRIRSCPNIDPSLETGVEFSHERYPHKVFIHSLILVAQFILYFGLLIVLDTVHLPVFHRHIHGEVNRREEDADVDAERHRIEAMDDQERQNEALVVDNLTKRYHGSSVPAVNRLTFAIPHRQCFGLLGFNGSGKTTTFRMLVGELRPTSGHVYKNNKDSIGYCPQDDIGFSALNVSQSIGYICRLHGLQPSSLNDLILAQFQLDKYRTRLVSHLSGGTRRRLHLALCLIGSPSLLLLDEPTAKVDPLLRSHIRVVLQHRPIDTSLVLASHSMLECEQLCDRLTILVRGHARCLGSPAHLKDKYGTDYRVRLTPLQPGFEIPSLKRVDNNTNEYTCPKGTLSRLFASLEQLVEQHVIAPNYTIQLTSLEHIFLGFQHPLDTIV